MEVGVVVAIPLLEGSDEDEEDGAALATPSTTAKGTEETPEGVTVGIRMDAGSGVCSFDSEANESGRYSATSIVWITRVD